MAEMGESPHNSSNDAVFDANSVLLAPTFSLTRIS
jgi:hypothetical protein